MSQTLPTTESIWRFKDVAWLLIGIATVIQVARILGMTAVNGELPFLSANDRSRWCAIAALTEDGKWEIDRITELLDSKGKSKIWNSIDIVRHRGADGKEHFYSSKPPLLTAMYALVCKPVTWVFRKKLTDEPFLIGRSVMLLVNVLPLALWWIWLTYWLEKNVADVWSRFVLLNMALWGTFLTTFAATLNNHLHAALFFALSLGLVWQIINAHKRGQSKSRWLWIACGLCAGMAVACELPALAWAAAASVILSVINWRKFLSGYLLANGLVAIAFFTTNYWAHQDLRPPYAHRGVGASIATIPKEPENADAPAIDAVIAQANQHGYAFTDKAKIIPARLTDVLQCIDDSVSQRVAIESRDGNWRISHWDDWYDFPKSYWLPVNKKGVDRGEPNPWLYAFHFTIGHHGIFSLTPFWLLGIVGAALWIRSKWDSSHGWNGLLVSEAGVALALTAVSLACFLFYATRVVEDRNYGGVCSGFRWVFWLVPAWLWLCVPAVEIASRFSTLRKLIGLLLLISIFSAAIPWPNPWTHPWPYRAALWLYPEPPEAKPPEVKP